MKILSKGQFSGKASSNSEIYSYILSTGVVHVRINFTITLDEKITGCPTELLVMSNKEGIIRKEDKVLIKGEVCEVLDKDWDRKVYWIDAKSIFNETLMKH